MADENKDKIDRLESEITALKKELITAKQQYEIEISKLKQQLNTNEFDDDDEKDEEIAINALKRMGKKGKNIKEFMWKTMSELCYENDDQINTSNHLDDEKKNNNNNYSIENDENQLSQLIDIKEKEMCKYGHHMFKDGKYLILDNKCIQCSSMNGRKYCMTCSTYDKNDIFASARGKGISSSDVKEHIYCINCRKTNSETIKKRIKANKMKAEIIRKELVKNPKLERDLLCNMERRASVDSLINDINKLDVILRSHWILLLFDMDNLKAWNTAIGHVSTDKLIKQIGDIMHKYVDQINNGKWINKNDINESLSQAFVYRTGGDEFVMAIRGQNSNIALKCKLYNFYNSFKSEINLLGSNIKEFVNKNEWKETQKKLNNAIDRNGEKINLNIVGLSCGIFIPNVKKSSIKDWLSVTDKIALEKAKHSNGINKNGCAIFYELINDVIPSDKVLKCLKMGVRDGRK